MKEKTLNILSFKLRIEKKFPELLKEKLLIAVSGGIDSMVLLYLVKEIGCKIGVAHVNYGLRGKDSEEDFKLVQTYCELNKIKFHSKSFIDFTSKHNNSIQTIAREYRYKWFKEICKTKNYKYILTAHHLEDQIETFMINISRGTGISGILGIKEKNGNIRRPLLFYSKKEISKFAKNNDVQWREDITNSMPIYLRNKLRTQIIEQWQNISPNLIQGFYSSLTNLTKSHKLYKNYIKKIRRKLFIGKKSYRISIKSLKKLEPLNHWIYELFYPYGFSKPKEINKLLDSQSGKVLISSSHEMLKDRECILLRKINYIKPLEYKINGIGEYKEPIRLRISLDNKIYRDQKNISVDKNMVLFPLTLRKWKMGDTFYPFGLGKKKKLSTFFKNEKYSIFKKQSQWILVNGNGEIIWVVKKRLDERFRVTDNTKNILSIQLL